MKIGGIEVNLNERELELLRLVHPLFMGMSFREAAVELQCSPTTVTKIWDRMVEKYPMLAETMKKWDNPYNIHPDAVRKAWRFSEMDDIVDPDCESDDDTFLGERVRMWF